MAMSYACILVLAHTLYLSGCPLLLSPSSVISLHCFDLLAIRMQSIRLNSQPDSFSGNIWLLRLHWVIDGGRSTLSFKPSTCAIYIVLCDGS